MPLPLVTDGTPPSTPLIESPVVLIVRATVVHMLWPKSCLIIRGLILLRAVSSLWKTWSQWRGNWVAVAKTQEAKPPKRQRQRKKPKHRAQVVSLARHNGRLCRGVSRNGVVRLFSLFAASQPRAGPFSLQCPQHVPIFLGSAYLGFRHPSCPLSRIS